MPIFFTISSFKTFGGCQSIQLQKLHLNSNDIVQLRLTDQYQLQKLHADFFHYIQFQNVRRVPVYPTTQTTLQFESHMKGLANWTWPTTETTGRFFSLYPVWKGKAYPTTETTSDFESDNPDWEHWPIPTTETTCRFFSLYPVSKQSEAANYINYTCFRITISSLERV